MSATLVRAPAAGRRPAEPPARTDAPTYRVLGVEITALTLAGLGVTLDRAIADGRRVFIANHNLHSVYLYHRVRGMRELYARAHATIIDGMPLVLAGRCLGLPLGRRHRLATLDWIGPVMARAAANGWRVFVLAGRPGVAERGAAVLRRRHPGLQILTATGYFDAAPGSADSRAMVRRINAWGPELLLVGMGMPRQEEWLADHLDQLDANAVFNVGAVMDYIAGEIPTPPRWTGRLGVEWLYRLVTTPARTARRYLIEPWSLVPLFARDMARRRVVSPPQPAALVAPAAPASADILGVSVDLLTMAALTERIATLVARRGRHVVGNHNLHSVCLYHRHPRMRSMYERATLTFIEGMSLVAAGRLLGLPTRRVHRIAVLDWIHPLMARAAAEGWRVFVVGGAPGIARRAAERLAREHPGLVIDTASGYFDTSPGGSDNAWMLERINRFRPDLLLVGMGMPRQEIWIADNHDRLDASVVLNVGGLMDCIAGEIPTAPRWLGRYGLEWLFRLVATPNRTAVRYLVEPWTLLPRLWHEMNAHRRTRHDAAIHDSLSRTGGPTG
ncbi:MAG TPA: WecB/TagA/CpsF family glycosyltransferase [Gemmatimonadales bacterium]|nr:WecB/TagA/CpsF family glycosyltransferase [Gemmatimonadales bacterium]